MILLDELNLYLARKLQNISATDCQANCILDALAAKTQQIWQHHVSTDITVHTQTAIQL